MFQVLLVITMKCELIFLGTSWNICYFNLHCNHPCVYCQCFGWLSSFDLQPIAFELYFINDLLVSTRYHLGLSLAQRLHNTSLVGWRFHSLSLWDEKEGVSIFMRDGHIQELVQGHRLLEIPLALPCFNYF
jgi:hypothetical protein